MVSSAKHGRAPRLSGLPAISLCTSRYLVGTEEVAGDVLSVFLQHIARNVAHLEAMRASASGNVEIGMFRVAGYKKICIWSTARSVSGYAEVSDRLWKSLLGIPAKSFILERSFGQRWQGISQQFPHLFLRLCGYAIRRIF